MSEEKIKDIIHTMIEFNLLDTARAAVDKNYLIDSVIDYIKAANIARESLHMKPLI